MSEQALSKVDAAIERLTPDEHIEYAAYCRSGKPDLSVGTSLKLYELFLQGLPCAEIAKLNEFLGLGAVLKARVDHRWDDRRDAYLADLYAGANDRLRQVGAESLNFLGLALAAAHKDQGAKMKKYLQTGDPKDLGPMQVVSFKQYREIIETLIKLTGQDQKKVVRHEGSVAVTGDSAPGPGGAKLTPEIADAMRALMGKK